MQPNTTLLAEGDTTVRMRQLHSTQGVYRLTVEAKQEHSFKTGKRYYMFSKKGHTTNLFAITEGDVMWKENTTIADSDSKDLGFRKKAKKYLNSFISLLFSCGVCKRMIYHKSLCRK